MPTQEDKQQMNRYEHLCAKLASLQHRINVTTTLVSKVNLVGEFLVLLMNAEPSDKPDFINRMCIIADEHLGGDWTLLKAHENTIVLRRRAVNF